MMHSINFWGFLHNKLSNMFVIDWFWMQTHACATIGYKEKKLVMLVFVGPRLTGLNCLKDIKNTYNL